VSAKWLMFVMAVYTVGMLLALAIEGSVQGDLVRVLTGYSVAELQGPGVLAVPKMGAGFLLRGLPKVLSWDFSFLAGEWAIVRWMLVLLITVPTVVSLGAAAAGAAQGVFSRWILR
jgi:hypothetical protein